MAALSLVFDLIGRDVSASKAFKDVGDSAEKASRKAHESTGILSNGFKMAGAALLGAGLISGLKYLYDQAAESAKIGRLTTQVIISTGGAAKITAAQVGSLATAISNKTGVDDEAIQSGENLLLTFTKVRNETGKGNDIFNQATQTITDMSAALGQDTSASAIQLGKALNDPIKGVTALQKVGVSFTASQKDQIKTLVAAGNTMGAQKVILKELGTEFGGAAAAASTPLDKLQVNLGNLAEQVGGYLMPVVNDFSNFAIKTLLPALMRLGDWIGTNLGPIFKTVFSEISGAVIAFGEAWKYNDGEVTSSGLPGFMERVGYYARQTFDFIKTKVIPTLIEFGGWIQRNSDWLQIVAAGVLGAVVAFKAFMFIKSVIAAVAAFNAVLLANPIGLVIAAIAALVVGLVIAYKKSETFRDIVNGVFKAVAATAGWLWNNILKPYFEAIGTIFHALGTGIGWVFTHLIEPTFTAFGKLVGTIKDGFKTAVEAIGKIWNGIVGALKTPVQIVIDVVWNNGLRRLWNTVNNIWGGKDLAEFKFADGGMMPGYTPGRDVHKFYSPTAGMLELSGGEPVLRPEAGAVLGRGWVDGINAAARRGGRAGVSRFLGGYADGGHVSLGDRALGFMGSGLGSALTSLLVPGGSMLSQVASYVAQEKAATADRGGSPIYGLVGDMFRSVANSLWGVLKKSIGSLGGNFGAGTPASSAPSSQAANVAIVRSWASPYGWQSGAEWDALVSVVNRESGFRNTAQNPVSSAYGMFQFLNATWAAMGGSKTSDPIRQAQLGLKYISQVYGDPLGALRHEQAFGWYDNGGWLKPGLTMAYNGTGKPERIRTAEQESALHRGGPITIQLDGPATTRLLEGHAVRVVDNALGSAHDLIHNATGH